MTLGQIAEECGYSDPSAARKAILSACKQMPAEGLEKLRAMETAKLDTAEGAIWDEVKDGSPKHLECLDRIMRRRAAMMGLDAPSKVDATVKHELPDDPAALKMRLLTVLEGLNANATAPDTHPVDGAGGPPADPGDVDPNQPKL